MRNQLCAGVTTGAHCSLTAPDVYAPSDTPWHALGATRTSAGEALWATLRAGLGGVPVRVKDGASLLVDAAEEVGLHLSERIERHTHDQRRVTAGRSSRRLKIEEITDYLERSRRVPDPKLHELQIQALLEQAQRPGDTLDIGTAWPETPTERYLLLQLTLQKAQADKAPAAVVERLERALADVEAAADLQVRADLATIEQAARFDGASAQGIARFQASLHTVLGKPTLVQAFKEALALADKDGSRLDRAIHHLMDALGTCLYALGSTREKVLLQALVTDLYHLKCLNTLFEDAQSVVRDVRRMVQQDPAAQGAGDAAAS
jgi:type III secretion protein W